MKTSYGSDTAEYKVVQQDSRSCVLGSLQIKKNKKQQKKRQLSQENLTKGILHTAHLWQSYNSLLLCCCSLSALAPILSFIGRP